MPANNPTPVQTVGTDFYGDANVKLVNLKDINSVLQAQIYVDVLNNAVGFLAKNGLNVEYNTVDDYSFPVGYKQAYFYLGNVGYTYPFTQFTAVKDGVQVTSATVSADPTNPFHIDVNSVQIFGIGKKGGISLNTVATATSVNSTGESVIGVTDTSSARTITIDTDDEVAGRVLIVKDESGGAATHNITVDTEGSSTIDGASSKVISTNYGVLRMYFRNGNWFTF